MVLIAPSILSADFSKMGQELERIKNADWIHCDVMDGHFVPNITFGPKMVEDIRKLTDKPLDVHLMIENPEKYLDRFIAAGSDYVTIHLESTKLVGDCLEKIRAAGRKSGLAISPDTPIDSVLPFVKQCDLLLLMSVYPGFSGQKFIEASVERLQKIVAIRNKYNPDCIIEMDGGIGAGNLGLLVKNGLQVAVGGNSVFAAPDPAAAIDALKKL